MKRLGWFVLLIFLSGCCHFPTAREIADEVYKDSIISVEVLKQLGMNVKIEDEAIKYPEKIFFTTSSEFIIFPNGQSDTRTVDLDLMGCLTVGKGKQRIFVENLDAQLQRQGYAVKEKL